MKDRWYKSMAFYQVWPRSFKDGNGDGIGDLYGVFDKLDYIRSVGVDGIWFSPLYVSPNADYGYDIADYRNISSDYGDLASFQKVLDKAHALGLKVVMDLVVNHTSDEHEWFQKSRRREEPYTDYYIWRPAKPGGALPNNWDSLFEGKAWEFDDVRGEYYLHLFAKKQPDLNMDNPAVREEVKSIMRFWLDMGVDGFREDVITFISKAEGLPDDSSPVSKGMKYFVNGPHLHEYLAEFRRDVLDRYDCFALGEAPMMTPEKALPFIAEGEGQTLDLMFHFQHMEADCLFTEYLPMPFSLRKLKRAFSRWQKQLAGKAWNTLYLENHDHPRIISRYGSERYRVESGKMLAAAYLFQQGTPFVYQGQEIGMTNIVLPSIDEYEDVLAKNNYAKYIRKQTPEKALKRIQRACRDSARTPMQWSGGPYAGFSEQKPWFALNPNFPEVNVAKAEADPDSILNFYRAALKLRKETPAVLWGDYREYRKGSKKLYAYSREYEGKKLLVICSFTSKRAKFKAPKGFALEGKEPVLCNYPDAPLRHRKFKTRPYETRVYVLSQAAGAQR